MDFFFKLNLGGTYNPEDTVFIYSEILLSLFELHFCMKIPSYEVY